MAKKTIPRPDADFTAFAAQFLTAVEAWRARHGIDPPFPDPLAAPLIAWRKAHGIHLRSQAAALAAREAKDESRAQLEAQIRGMARMIQADPVTTDFDRANMQLTIRNSASGGEARASGPHDAPGTAPLVRITSGGRLTHTIHLRDSATPGRRRKPRDAARAEVWMRLAEPSDQLSVVRGMEEVIRCQWPVVSRMATARLTAHWPLTSATSASLRTAR